MSVYQGRKMFIFEALTYKPNGCWVTPKTPKSAAKKHKYFIFKVHKNLQTFRLFGFESLTWAANECRIRNQRPRKPLNSPFLNSIKIL
jgi:hypothetical protein